MFNSLLIIEAFKSLNCVNLSGLDNDSSYSYDYKFEFIEKLDALFKEYKNQGIERLDVKEVNCKVCYPNKPSYEFYNPKTNEMVCRYVIFQESKDFIRVEECTNKSTFNPFSKENLQ
jgi:hypothetical protein